MQDRVSEDQGSVADHGPFEDRRDAGRRLAGRLAAYRDQPGVLVLALPRGGVPVGYEVARALRVPFDVFLVRKLGVPGRDELAIGAIASGGVTTLNDDVVHGLRIAPETIQQVADRERRELARRERVYREGRPMPGVRGATVILVDDGLATGASMRAAVLALRELRPDRVVVAVPAAPAPACQQLRALVDETVCLTTPSPFLAVGAAYENFAQTTDAEVRHLLRTVVAGPARPTAVGATAEPGEVPETHPFAV